jgi:geranylgeranyl pyrophosphate synthase
MAILAGDGLQAEAFGLLAREPDTEDPAIVRRKLRVIQIVADAAGAGGMVGGQALDLAAVPAPGEASQPAPPGLAAPRARSGPMGAEGLEGMHARKTGAIIRASALAGAVMAGAGPAMEGAVDRYAGEIGLAFQIIDDILDVEGDAAGLGKTAGKDAEAGKPTYPALYGLEQSRALARACLDRAEGALAEAKLLDSPLGDIARWIVTRQA